MSLPVRWPEALSSRGLRLWSGSILGLYLLCHFVNIAFGLVSVGAMEAAAPVLADPWHSLLGTVLLGGAFLIHFGLSLRALHRRRTLQMSAREAAQLGLGLVLPFLITSHVVAARIEPALTGMATTFADQVDALWVRNPVAGARQGLALVVAWAHGCFGFWFALRGRGWFQRWTWLLYGIALLVPILALLGFAEAGREIVNFADVAATVTRPPPGPISAEDLHQALLLGFAGSLGLVLVARAARQWRGRHRRVRVTYAEGRSVSVPRGYTVLEASRVAGIPHVSVCGGRGRCSTCRVRIVEGQARLPEPHAHERATLARSRAGPNVRLACQLRPTHDVTVMPIYAVSPAVAAGTAPRLGAASQERDLAVLFCDLRGFTRRAELWLPFDTVFLLNRYFEMVGAAVDASGGYLDKFLGDGALALFGLTCEPEDACRQALDAAGRITRGLEGLNAQFAAELSEPLRIAIGLHLGPAVVGDMGYGQAIALTAVGDGINVASRLEGEAKERDVEAVISAEVLRRAGMDPLRYEAHAIAVRGREAPVDAVLVTDAARLAETVVC